MNRWCLSPSRELAVLAQIAGKFPPIGDVFIGDRPILSEVEQDPNRLEEILTLATQVALDRPRAVAETADAVELRVRRRIRHLIEIRQDYLVALRSVVLAFCRLDDTFEQIISPPAVEVPARPGSGLEALNDHARQIAETRGRLVALWTTFLAERVALDRDLGRLPFTDWPKFFGQFALEPIEIKPAPSAERLPLVPSPLISPPAVPPPIDPGER